MKVVQDANMTDLFTNQAYYGPLENAVIGQLVFGTERDRYIDGEIVGRNEEIESERDLQRLETQRDRQRERERIESQTYFSSSLQGHPVSGDGDVSSKAFKV